MNDQDLIKLIAIKDAWPDLRADDLYLLARIADAKQATPLMFIRENPNLFGTYPKFSEALKRLLDAGLIERVAMEYQATNYVGKKNRPNRIEYAYRRTAKPLIATNPTNEFIL